MIRWKLHKFMDVVEDSKQYGDDSKRYIEALETFDTDEDHIYQYVLALEIRDELDKELLRKMREYAQNNV